MKIEVKWAKDRLRENCAFGLQTKLLKQIPNEYLEFVILGFGRYSLEN